MESIKTSNNNELACTIWGPPRRIILKREPNKSLGISIVGGKLDICTKANKTTEAGTSLANNKENSTFISGIFIKHVLSNSPAGLNGTLHTGDRILAVDGVDLVNGNHDKAVEVIRNSKTTVEFLIQSLLINEDEVSLMFNHSGCPKKLRGNGYICFICLSFMKNFTIKSHLQQRMGYFL